MNHKSNILIIFVWYLLLMQNHLYGGDSNRCSTSKRRRPINAVQYCKLPELLYCRSSDMLMEVKMMIVICLYHLSIVCVGLYHLCFMLWVESGENSHRKEISLRAYTFFYWQNLACVSGPPVLIIGYKRMFYLSYRNVLRCRCNFLRQSLLAVFIFFLSSELLISKFRSNGCYTLQKESSISSTTTKYYDFLSDQFM